MSRGLARPWQYTLWRLALVLLGATLLGGAIGLMWQALALTLAGALAWHFLRLHRLMQQVNSRRRLPPPQGWGALAELGQLLYLRQRDTRARKLRLLRMLRAFREAAAALPDAIVVLDAAEFRILWFNEATHRLLGLRYPQDLGTRLSNLLRSPRVAAWLGENGREPLLDLPSPADENLRLSLRLMDYTEKQRLLVVRDVSKLMHLEQVRRDFVANVSHELRTPLTVVHGYLDLLDPEDMPELATMLREMRQQSRRMTQIVEDLLTLSRLEVQDHLPAERIAMRPLLQSLRQEALALSAGQHTIVLDDQAGIDLLGS
jgi:two-component system, OmpR family, phosphate regulon sensor histidine kinase PhoR